MARRARKSRAGLRRWKQLVGCLRSMNMCFNNVRLYPPTHQEVRASIDNLHKGLAPVFEDQDDVGFGFMEQMLYIEGTMSIEETQANEMLVERFTQCRVKYLTIGKGATQEELLAFFTLLNDASKKAPDEPLGELLGQMGIKSVHVIEAEISDLSSKTKLGRRTTLLDWYHSTVETLMPVHDEIFSTPKADLKPLYRVADDLMATIRTKGHEPFLLLPAVSKGMDPHVTHSINTAVLACAIGEGCKLNTGQLQTLCVAAFLHDIGRKIIPIEWAEDPNPLTLFERAVVHQHSSWGFLLLARNAEVPPQLALLAGKHHENPCRPPASGYEPDIMHKILNIADAYDLAEIGDKYYWRKHAPHRVLRRVLRRRGVEFDPTLAKVLVQAVGLYPPGTLVRLDDGQKGIVVRPNGAHVARPKVYLFEAPPPEPEAKEGEDLVKREETEPPPAIADLVDLDTDSFKFRRTIDAVLDPKDFDVASLVDQKKEYLLTHGL